MMGVSFAGRFIVNKYLPVVYRRSMRTTVRLLCSRGCHTYEIKSKTRLEYKDHELPDFWKERIAILEKNGHNLRVDVSLPLCIARDELIRGFLEDCFWWKGPIFDNLQYLLLYAESADPTNTTSCREWLDQRKRYPFIFDWPWSPLRGLSPYQGSALLSDGKGHFLVLEVGSTREFLPGSWVENRKTKTAASFRNRKRRNIKARLLHHVRLWHSVQTHVFSTEGVGFMDNDMYMVGPLIRSADSAVPWP